MNFQQYDMPIDPVLCGALTISGDFVDIFIRGTHVGEVRPSGHIAPEGRHLIDCRGKLVSPSFVEGHIHLDKTHLGLALIPHVAGGTVTQRISAEKEIRRRLPASVAERGGRLIEQIAAFGTGFVRTHVDIDTELGLSSLHEVLRLKERYVDLVDIQIVAFPQSGILRDPGTFELLNEALANGADLVGGLDPAGIDDDIEGHLAAVFALAERHDAGIDIHLHDTGALGGFELRQIAARTKAAGLQGKVAVSHAYALGDLCDHEFGRTAESLASAGVAIMTNGPGTGSMPPVLELRSAGVTVFAGSDNIRDAWWPYGNGDMLDRAMMIGYRQNICAKEDLAYCFDMATTLPARVLGLDGYGIAPGCKADLVILASASVQDAVLDRPVARTVLKSGRVIVESGRRSSRPLAGGY